MGLPALRDLPIFEVDHPATSAVKRKQIEELDASISQVAFVPVDFDREQLSDALSNAGFQGKRRTLVIWEGVTNYLTAAAVDATLRWIGSLAEGSRLISHMSMPTCSAVRIVSRMQPALASRLRVPENPGHSAFARRSFRTISKSLACS
jgi:methyltransferase (TIGR00027 family)